MEHDYKQEIVALTKKVGAIRPKDLSERGIPRKHLYSLFEEGTLQRSSRGIYWHADSAITENHSLVEVARRMPNGVVSLLSALRFHQLTTQNPFQVWIAIHPKARKPRIEYPPLRIVRFSGNALTEGIEVHHIEGVEVKIYSPAKTVADCFKYRNKVGIDVAVEALKDTLKQRKASFNDIYHYAVICRVAEVMRPYIETVQ